MDHTQLDTVFARFRRSAGADDLAQLFDFAADDLFALGVRLLRDANAAEDVLQETFLDLARGQEQHDGARAAWPYLAGMMRNRALAHRRREERIIDEDRLAKSDEANLSPESAAERSELTAWLKAAVAELPDASRRVIDFVLNDGLRPAEIASRLETSPGAVRTALHRGIARLREQAPVGATMPLGLIAFEGRGLGSVREAVLAKVGAGEVAAASAVASTSSANSAAGSGSLATSTKLGGFFGTKLALGGLALVLVAGAVQLWVVSQDDASQGAVSSGEFADANASGSRLAARREAGSGAESKSSGVDSQRTVAASLERTETADEVVSATPIPAADASGEFSLRAGEGYSFAQGAVVPPDQADFVFEGPGKVRATKGMSTRFLRVGENRSPAKLLEAIVRLRTDAVQSHSRSSFTIPNERSGSHLFALPADGGGWRLVAHVYEKEDAAHFRFRSTTSVEGRFREDVTKMTVCNGAFLDAGILKDEDQIKKQAERQDKDRTRSLHEALAKLDRRAAELNTPLLEDDGFRVSGLLDRRLAGRLIKDRATRYRWFKDDNNHAYQSATFSFEHGLRDDPDLRVTRNDWALQFSGNGVHTKMVTDDRSQLWWVTPGANPEQLSVVDIAKMAERNQLEEDTAFLVHTLDSETDQWTFVRVLALRPNHSVIFAWKNLESGDLPDDLKLAGRTMMDSPRVVARMRMAHDGGNPSEVFLDRSPGGYYDEFTRVTPGRIREFPIDSKDETEVDIEGGGALPSNQTWVVTRITWEGAIGKDGGNIRIVLAGKKLFNLEKIQPWTRGEWTGRIEVKDADLRRSFVSASYFTAVEVIFEGHFE